MKILLKNIKLLAQGHPYNGKKVFIGMENGKISLLSEAAPTAFSGESYEAEGLSCSLGWMDMQAALCEPGYEHRETIEQLCEAAAAGGFTDVAVQPNTYPTIQTKESIRFLLHQQEGFATHLHPLAAVTLNTEGKELTEMVDLHHAGALAFSDGQHTIWHTGLMLRAMQYLQNFDGLLIYRPENTEVSVYGHMHEGVVSTMMGTKGIPAIAESMAINQALYLHSYYGGRLHFSNVSTAESIRLIRNAKKEGKQVSCDVAAFQFSFTDHDLMGFNTNLKVNPPLRTKIDAEALMAGLKDGTIDCVVSAHLPQDIESKELEFDLAAFGAIGIETAFSAIFSATQGKFGLPSLIEKMTVMPRKILGLPLPELAEGATACLTLFDENLEWAVTAHGLKSPSKNSPFLGQTLKGKPLGIINGEKSYLADSLLARKE